MTGIRPYRSRLLLPETLPFSDAQERRWFYNYRGAGGPYGDLNALMMALGGNDSVSAFYDVRLGVTVSSGTVTAWTDVRGNRYGPTLDGTGHAPAWDADNLLIQPDGSASYLTSAASALFDLAAAKTLLFVGTVPSGETDAYPVGLAFSSVVGNNSLALRRSADGFIRGVFRGGVAARSAVPPGAARRAIVLAKDASTNASIQVLSETKVVAHPAAAPSANTTLTVGGSFAGAGLIACDVRMVAVLDHEATAEEAAAFGAWAAEHHGAVLA